MKIYIKNMVCDRCKMAVANLFSELNISVQSISLGEVDCGESGISNERLVLIRDGLDTLGFELIDDKKSRLIEKIKSTVIALVHQYDGLARPKLSEYLRDRLHYDYGYLSNLFSSVEGITIEQFLIKQKIEKAKELLVYDELSLTEISGQLGYSSVAHLSSQFKKVTGMTPTQFKKLRDTRQRYALDKV